MTITLEITEWQTGVADPEQWPLGSHAPGAYVGRAAAGYRYDGTQDGLHVFVDDAGQRGLYSRHSHPVAGWHLRRGRYYYSPARFTWGSRYPDDMLHAPPAEQQSTIFRDHRCWKCQDGKKPCVQGHPNRCEYPHARND